MKSSNRLATSDLIPIGKIVNTHGIHGKIRLAYYNEDKTSFFSYQKVLLRNPRGDLASVEISDARIHGRFVLVQFQGIDTLGQAQPLVGATVLVEKATLPALEEGEYYWTDLIGMEVMTVNGDRVGEVTRIIPTGGTDVLVIEKGEKEILVPATEERIREIDTTSRRMVVDRIEGLTDDDPI